MADAPIQRNPGDDEFEPGGDEPMPTLPAVRESMSIAQPGTPTFSTNTPPPWLQVVHGVGKLDEAHFTAGALVLDKTVVVYEPPQPAKKGGALEAEEPALMTVLKAHKYWKERLPWPSPEGVYAREFATEAEAIKAGMITRFPPRNHPDSNDRSKWPNCGEAAVLYILLQEPEGVEDRSYYMIPIAGKWYAPARFAIDKTSYAELAPTIAKADTYSHRILGLPSATFALTTKTVKIKSTGNFTWVPTARVASTKTEAEIKAIYDLFGPKKAE